MSPSADQLIICEAKDFNVDIALAPIGYYFEPRCDDFFWYCLCTFACILTSLDEYDDAVWYCIHTYICITEPTRIIKNQGTI